MQCLKQQKLSYNLFETLTCIYSLRKSQEVEFASNRYSKAKMKYLKSYDPKIESKDVIYLDEK